MPIQAYAGNRTFSLNTKHNLQEWPAQSEWDVGWESEEGTAENWAGLPAPTWEDVGSPGRS